MSEIYGVEFLTTDRLREAIEELDKNAVSPATDGNYIMHVHPRQVPSIVFHVMGLSRWKFRRKSARLAELARISIYR